MTQTLQQLKPERFGFMLKVLDGMTSLANVAGSLLIVGLVVLITSDVVRRNFFDAPISGVPELVSLSIVAIVFLQAPEALRSGRFTRSDAVINLLSLRGPRVARALETLFDLIGIGVLAAILYAQISILERAWTREEFVGAVGDFVAPTWPVKAMLALGALLLALQFAARIVRRFGMHNDAI